MRVRIEPVIRALFPPFCQYCGKEGRRWLCEGCNAKLPPRLYTNCPQCSRGSEEGNLAPACKQHTGLTRFLAAYQFSSPIAQKLVHTYKFQGSHTLHDEISRMMIAWIAGHNLEHAIAKHNMTAVPVPLAKRRKRERGFNQAELIAKDIAAELGLPYIDALVRTKYTAQQIKAVHPEARRKNIESAFAIDPRADTAGKHILLIDDVYTTGATMKECARVLRAAGARQIWGFTFAK